MEPGHEDREYDGDYMLRLMRMSGLNGARS